ncbi:putative Calnexin [Monocercomonoides exilis]|uniref:putative Calnexin n=1 Tax=Monocercomonoides exilis TaxID=2049356 RepID=UPI003559741D|nr:putative Calnexin [Monocercomonoides exilis]|eukprot:MONOS_4536.1-p1 / transcript=MONOS_4536.1 / gene=MONOS_4536 / organism=Monocercomonoides_exilis_PA203 / gene_product=Calnexin / transcript_product=Calnexin / location=Mono_scaffold00121:103792-105899(-) / protein_length=655 / sequence_SO=supercontig / SO=protein_coding / is_pseudo=false
MIFIFLVASAYSEIVFFEDFEEDTIGTKWIHSENPSYNGSWAIENRTEDVIDEGRKGLTTLSPKSLHAISTKKSIVTKGDEFVLQYEMKVQKPPFDCGGGYIKLLTETFDPKSFDGSSDYAIMFGPDRCGSKNTVQFLFRSVNPINKVATIHQLTEQKLARWDNSTHLYRLVIHDKHFFDISIDGEIGISGDLFNSSCFNPPLLGPKEIIDPNDKKPDDWVEIRQIPDPSDAKPADWDESEPEFIEDKEATMPDDWDEDTQPFLDDPKAVKPADWDEEIKGEWHPPQIRNPMCVLHGCGEWKPPMKKNPKYRGMWKPRLIPNPEYKGEWKARTIKNENYTDYEGVDFGHIKAGGIGFEILNIKEGLLFDDILIADSVEEAERVANETWSKRHQIEEEEKVRLDEIRREERRKREEASKPTKHGVISSLFSSVKEFGNEFLEDHPLVFVIVIVLSLLVVVLLVMGIVVCCQTNCGRCTRSKGGNATGDGKKKLSAFELRRQQKKEWERIDAEVQREVELKMEKRRKEEEEEERLKEEERKLRLEKEKLMMQLNKLQRDLDEEDEKDRKAKKITKKDELKESDKEEEESKEEDESSENGIVEKEKVKVEKNEDDEAKEVSKRKSKKEPSQPKKENSKSSSSSSSTPKTSKNQKPKRK